MLEQMPVSSSPALTLVQQALGEVLWRDLEVTNLPRHLQEDVEKVRKLDGEFIVVQDVWHGEVAGSAGEEGLCSV